MKASFWKAKNRGVLAVAKTIHLYKSDGLIGIWHRFKIFAASRGLGFGKYDRNDYCRWIRRYDTITAKKRAAICACIDGLIDKPLISVAVAIYNPKREWLIQTIESVCRQSYPNWEICIADSGSTDDAVRPILERYARDDERIKVIFSERGIPISTASNYAIGLTSGNWVVLLSQEGLLSEDALFWVVNAIHQNPDVRLIYSDEDKIDETGKRFDPDFKCDWNIDLFYSHNFFAHLCAYRADLLKTIGGFRENRGEAQDYDLVLRCIECIAPEQIHHIPRLLYHSDTDAERTAQLFDAKPGAMLARENALNEHFQRKGINARAESSENGCRVRYTLPAILPLVSLIIPTRNGLQLIRQCVESVLDKTTYPHFEVLIIDNDSDDPQTLQYFDKLQAEVKVRVVRDSRPFNYSALNNTAAQLARGEVLGLINNDVEVISPEWLSEMVSIAMQPQVGAVGARLWYPDDTLQHAGIILVRGVAGHAHKHLPRGQFGYHHRAALLQSFSAVTGACLVIRKSIYEEVGGLNETDLKIAFNDVDFCLRLREAGYRNVWTPYAELYHHESATRGNEDTPEKYARLKKEVQYMKQRWGDLLLNDPAYNPNLTFDHEDFSLAWPPRIKHCQ